MSQAGRFPSFNLSKRRAIFRGYDWDLGPAAHAHIALFGAAYAY